METIVLKAARRNVTGKQVKALRRQGLLPAVLYGHSFEPINITLNAHDAAMVLGNISPSTIVTIDVEGDQHAALVRERQKDYVRNSLVHVDFQVISLTEAIRSAVTVETAGESPAVEEFNAVIVQNLNQIDVEALPRDLPERITVDISALKEVGDTIYVRDLPVSDKVTVLTPGDEIVVHATAAAPEEAEEEVEVEEEELTEPEVIERGKKDEDEE